MSNKDGRSSSNDPNELNSAGWRRWFTKSRQTLEVPEPSPKKPPANRSYTPRYADRDMAMSVPIAQRSDTAGELKERRLEGVCSEIGFSTDSLPRYSSTRRSLTKHTDLRAIHSDSELANHATAEATGYPSRGSWNTGQGSSGPSTRPLPARSCSSSMSNRSNELYWRGFNFKRSSGQSSDLNRTLGPASTDENTNPNGVRQLPGECCVNATLPQHRDAKSYHSCSDTPNHVPVYQLATQPREYFSHDSVRNLRGGKGKQPIRACDYASIDAERRSRATQQRLDLGIEDESSGSYEQDKSEDKSSVSDPRHFSYTDSSTSDLTYSGTSKGTSRASTVATERSEDLEELSEVSAGDEPKP